MHKEVIASISVSGLRLTTTLDMTAVYILCQIERKLKDKFEMQCDTKTQ